MSAKRIIITVDRKKVRGLDELVTGLKHRGVSVDEVDTLFETTHILGSWEGEPCELNSDGVVAEAERWVDAQSNDRDKTG